MRYRVNIAEAEAAKKYALSGTYKVLRIWINTPGTYLITIDKGCGRYESIEVSRDALVKALFDLTQHELGESHE